MNFEAFYSPVSTVQAMSGGFGSHTALYLSEYLLIYSKTCRKRPLKNRQNKGLKDK